MAKKCNKCRCNVPCGCQEALITSLPAECSSTNTCSEYVYTGCVIYDGPGITGPGIQPGMTLDEILQRLVLYAQDPVGSPDCLESAFDEGTVTTLKVTRLTSTSARITWSNVTNATSYTLQIAPAIIGAPFTLAAGTVYYDLTDLTPDTFYQVYITSHTVPGDCNSVTINFTTSTA